MVPPRTAAAADERLKKLYAPRLEACLAGVDVPDAVATLAEGKFFVSLTLPDNIRLPREHRLPREAITDGRRFPMGWRAVPSAAILRSPTEWTKSAAAVGECASGALNRLPWFAVESHAPRSGDASTGSGSDRGDQDSIEIAQALKHADRAAGLNPPRA